MLFAEIIIRSFMLTALQSINQSINQTYMCKVLNSDASLSAVEIPSTVIGLTCGNHFYVNGICARYIDTPENGHSHLGIRMPLFMHVGLSMDIEVLY